MPTIVAMREADAPIRMPAARRRATIPSGQPQSERLEKRLWLSSIALFIGILVALAWILLAQSAELLQYPQHRETVPVAGALLLLFGVWIWWQRSAWVRLRRSMPPEVRIAPTLT